MFGKVENGKFIPPPVNSGNMFNVYKNKEWLEANGFHELTDEEKASIVKEPIVPKAIKLSKLSIIEFLGEAWPTWKQKIVDAGAWDYWEACTYIETTNARFKPFFDSLTREEKINLLKYCRY